MTLPAPYYEHAGITIYHGDCREILPGLEPVDLVLTDPPYGIGEDGGQKNRWRTGDGRRKDGPLKYQKMDWDRARPSSDTFAQIMSMGERCAIFGGNHFADLLPPSGGWLFWDKNIGGDFSDGELVYTNFGNAIRKHTVHAFKDLRGGKDRVHPTQKPAEIMTWCIRQADKHFKPHASTILDPYMGSGTTLVAAKQLNRRAIGIEIEEKYCEIAARRLSQEVFDFSAAADGQ